jgi:hypothetical protein
VFPCFGFSRFLDTVTFYVKIWWEIGRLKEATDEQPALSRFFVCRNFGQKRRSRWDGGFGGRLAEPNQMGRGRRSGGNLKRGPTYKAL